MGKGGGQRGRVRSIFSVIIAFLEVLMGIIIPALTALYMLQPRGGSLTETEMHVVCALDGYDPLRPSICNLAYSAIMAVICGGLIIALELATLFDKKSPVTWTVLLHLIVTLWFLILACVLSRFGVAAQNTELTQNVYRLQRTFIIVLPWITSIAGLVGTWITCTMQPS
uniref:Uncharacterized protein n=1 Tax=Compsopogon caeruleus TaxID=31354 RepID=A0A7S1TJ09_9RHOD|mmetsp:Transcript_9385/g.19197  ORF Transcript_9385/g.19197 Transcript_9385/m.19197 type:complete len:169 (+) Transcript_9385:113-619(+)